MNYPNDNDPNDNPSLTDILLRHAATPEETRAIINVLHTWSRSDPNSFPAQLAAVTLLQWRAAANVPVEIARQLDGYQYLITEAENNFSYHLNERLEAFASTQVTFEESTKKMNTYLTDLYRLVDKGEKQLEQLNRNYEFFIKSANEQLVDQLEERKYRAWIWAIIGASLFAIALFVLLCIWADRPVHQDSADVSGVQTATQTP